MLPNLATVSRYFYVLKCGTIEALFWGFWIESITLVVYASKKAYFMGVSSGLSFHFIPLSALIVCFLSAEDSFFAIGTVFWFIPFIQIISAAYRTLLWVRRLHQLDIQLFINRQYRRLKPFADNMWVCYKLGTYARIAVVKQYAIATVVIAAELAYKCVCPSALFRGKQYYSAHSDGSDFCGGLWSLSLSLFSYNIIIIKTKDNCIILFLSLNFLF